MDDQTNKHELLEVTSMDFTSSAGHYTDLLNLPRGTAHLHYRVETFVMYVGVSFSIVSHPKVGTMACRKLKARI